MPTLLRFTTRRLAVLLVVATWLSPHSASAQAPATKHFLWKVQSGSGGVLYLAGSIHALGADVYPLDPVYQRAFDASDTLVEEIDLAEAEDLTALPALMAKGMYTDGRTFDSVVSKDTAARVAARLGSMPGLAQLLGPMKPWVVTLILTALQVQQAGLDPSLGLDKHFFDMATMAGKTVVGLETAASQIDLFDRMSDAAQEQMLRSTLDDLNAGDAELRDTISAWKRGDAKALETILLGGFRDLPGAYDTLIVQRNRNWIPRIETCLMASKPCMVVVGAAHLVGPDGLLTLLARKGYRIEQQ
jgi:uncharacterized protein YbaP (TraB family)